VGRQSGSGFENREDKTPSTSLLCKSQGLLPNVLL
jgi:hypothetical protein